MQAAKNDAFSNPTHFAGPEQPQIQVSQREQDPSADAVRHDAPGAEREQQFHVFNEEHQESGGGSGAPAFGDYLERRLRTRRKILQPVQREAPVIARILVKGMAERRDQVNVAAGRGDADDFAEHRAGIGDVFQHRIAFHAREDAGGKRQVFGIGGHVHAGDGQQVEIDVAVNGAAGSADVEIPAPERKIRGLGGIQEDGQGRLEQAAQAGQPAP